MASLGSIRVKCPSCGKKLPPIGVHVESVRNGKMLDVAIEPEFAPDWAEQVAATHPACVPFDH
jgi:hypothetical protein